MEQSSNFLQWSKILSRDASTESEIVLLVTRNVFVKCNMFIIKRDNNIGTVIIFSKDF